MPFLGLPSKRCGSGGSTLKLRCEIWPQSRSGGAGGMHTVGYDGSQLRAGLVVVFAGLGVVLRGAGFVAGGRVVTLGFALAGGPVVTAGPVVMAGPVGTARAVVGRASPPARPRPW
jgi:hypothetical protein